MNPYGLGSLRSSVGKAVQVELSPPAVGCCPGSFLISVEPGGGGKLESPPGESEGLVPNAGRFRTSMWEIRVRSFSAFASLLSDQEPSRLWPAERPAAVDEEEDDEEGPALAASGFKTE